MLYYPRYKNKKKEILRANEAHSFKYVRKCAATWEVPIPTHQPLTLASRSWTSENKLVFGSIFFLYKSICFNKIQASYSVPVITF